MSTETHDAWSQLKGNSCMVWESFGLSSNESKKLKKNKDREKNTTMQSEARDSNE